MVAELTLTFTDIYSWAKPALPEASQLSHSTKINWIIPMIFVCSDNWERTQSTDPGV